MAPLPLSGEGALEDVSEDNEEKREKVGKRSSRIRVPLEEMNRDDEKARGKKRRSERSKKDTVVEDADKNEEEETHEKETPSPTGSDKENNESEAGGKRRRRKFRSISEHKQAEDSDDEDEEGEDREEPRSRQRRRRAEEKEGDTAYNVEKDRPPDQGSPPRSHQRRRKSRTISEHKRAEDDGDALHACEEAEAEEEQKTPPRPRQRRRRDADNENDYLNDEDERLHFHANLDAKEAEERVDDDEESEEDGGEQLSPRKINKAGKPAEAGIVKRVHVENFMCHRKLTVDFCRNVNFIHGQNGSGKSAILAAIQICLGAGAKRTHRARNLKDLVRREAGEDSSGAKVRVTLLNNGSDSYRPDVYGESITVERCISLHGGYNGYKLLDHNLKERSRIKRDLDEMLDCLNIQVENPVAVLDQEEAKKFLTGKPEDKYDFFLKGTELERMDRSYAAAKDSISEMNQSLDRVQNSIIPKAEMVKRLREQWRRFQELDKLEDKKSDLRIQSGWAEYHACVEELDKHAEDLKELEAKYEKRQEELRKAEDQADAGDEEARYRERIEELTEEANQARDVKRQLETELREVTVPAKKAECQLSDIQREGQQARKQLKAAALQLKEEREKILAAAGTAESEEARRTQRLTEAEEALGEARNRLNTHKEAVGKSLEAYEELEPHLEQAKVDVSTVSAQIEGLRKKIQNMKSSSGNNLALFGQRCEGVYNMVQKAAREGKFRGPVVGPIGMHIKIAPGKEDYAKLAEQAIGSGVLDRFVVTNSADCQLFMRIRRDAGCHGRECNAFEVAPHGRYAVPPPPADDVETVASVLQIGDDLVFNTLVDMQQIDRKAVVKSREVSERALLVTDPNGREAIRGGTLSHVYFLPHGDHWTVRNGNRTMISNEKEMRQTIGIDRTEAIREAEGEIESLTEDLRSKREKQEKLAADFHEQKVVWNREQKGQKQAVREIETLQTTMAEIRAEQEAAATTVTIDTSELEEEVRAAEDLLEGIRARESEAAKEAEASKGPVKEVKQKLEDVTARNEKVLRDMAEAEKELEDYVRGRAQRKQILEKKRAKLAQYHEGLEGERRRLEEMESKQEVALRKARKLTLLVQRERARAKQKNDARESLEHGQSIRDEQENAEMDDTSEVAEAELEAIQPVVTDKEPKYYHSKIKRVDAQIQKERERRELEDNDPEETFEKYRRAKEDLETRMEQIGKIQTNRDALIKDLKSRRSRWRQFRQSIDRTSNMAFDEILNKKGSCGQIAFDHKARALNLIVQKDNTDEKSQTDDVKALSGGERSFTTLSLLLALGEAVETPFRVMDEFDVFLDPVSRKIALETMIDLAKQMEHRQFIFITPQDLSALTTDPMLKIIKLKAPERSVMVSAATQQTLDFESQQGSE